MTAPLSDLRIVEISAFVAAPLGGMTLGQLGADVIRIDPIGGGIDHTRWPLDGNGNSLYWASLNKAKRSVCLALGTGAGREIARALVAAPGPGGGIALTNFPPKGWLSHAELAAQRPDLILLRLNGNPDGSPAVDYTVNSASGLPMVTGNGEGPVNHVLPIWDVAAGLYIAVGLLAAERRRRMTGAGGEVTLSLFDVMLGTLGNLGYLAEAQLSAVPREAIGNHLYGAFGRDFATADGRRVMIVAITQGQWNALVAATGLGENFALAGRAMGADIATETGRFAARDALAAVLAPWCARHSLAALRAIFAEHGVLWGPYQDFQQLLNEDRRCSIENPLFRLVDQPGIGSLLTPQTPLALEGGSRPVSRRAPRLGEHTDEILAELLGLSSAQIGKLHDAKTVAGPSAS